MSKLTDWMKGDPPAVGEYNVSNSGDPTLRRWWNGQFWSVVYTDTAKKKVKLLRRQRAGRPYGISWRGVVDSLKAIAPLRTA